MPSARSAPRGPALGWTALVLVGLMSAFLVGRCSAPDGGGDDGTDLATDDDTEVEVLPPSTWGPDEAPNLVVDRPDAVMSGFHDRFHGPLAIRRLVIYPTYAFAEVQDPVVP